MMNRPRWFSSPQSKYRGMSMRMKWPSALLENRPNGTSQAQRCFGLSLYPASPKGKLKNRLPFSTLRL